jgi:hypothetical protein
MKIHIFTNDSGTTADTSQIALRDYYRGLFRQVRDFEKELSKYGDTELHVVSKEFGVAKGDERADKVLTRDAETPIIQIKDKLLLSADGEVVILLLTKDIFEASVEDIFDELVEVAKPNAIWCIGATKGSLESVQLDRLKEQVNTLLTYQRVGVARIGSEVRAELLEKVERLALED